MIYIIIAVVLFLILASVVVTALPSYLIYTKTLRKNSPEQWSRENNPEILPVIKEEGAVWHKENEEYCKEVHIVNGGLDLYGEFYDFGFKRAVIILSGRTETLIYGYYFARPYREADYNVLVIDPRAHGKSGGKFNTVGFEESKDALAWVSFLHDELGMESVIYHGICIGAATGMLGIASPKCPKYLEGIIVEGMFPCFNESMKNHLIERKKPVFPTLWAIDKWMRHFTGHSMRVGPINVIGNYHKPLLMLHSKEDAYSTPENAVKLFKKCPSKSKELVWFEKGGHSRLRPTDTKKYDEAIKDFINNKFNFRKEV